MYVVQVICFSSLACSGRIWEGEHHLYSRGPRHLVYLCNVP